MFFSPHFRPTFLPFPFSFYIWKSLVSGTLKRNDVCVLRGSEGRRYEGWSRKNRKRSHFKGRFVDSQHDKDISRPEGEKGWPLRIIKEKQQRKGDCWKGGRKGRTQRPRRRWLHRGILAKLCQRMSCAEKLIFSYVVLFKLPSSPFFPAPSSLSTSLFISIRYLQTVLLMKILALPIPRKSECTLPDGSSYSMCFASSSFAGSERDLRILSRYFLSVFFRF